MLAAGRIHPVNGSRYQVLKIVMRIEDAAFRRVGVHGVAGTAGILPRGNDSITIARVRQIYADSGGGDISN